MPQLDRSLTGQPVIIGAGLAGLAAALAAAPMPVVVLTKASLGLGANSAWAQGGIAAAMGAGDDCEAHAADTVAAGSGLCDAAAVRRIVDAGPDAIRQLEAWGVRFDREASGDYALSLEAAHSRRRVLHVGGGDTAGRRILEALVARVRATPSITVIEGVTARRLRRDARGITAVEAERLYDRRGMVLPTRRVAIATGGMGALWAHTTNPAGALGQGLALAAGVGADLIDLEFMQFHPTAIDIDRDPKPLASEALRGEGAFLVDAEGARIMAAEPAGDLAPRDVVARGVFRAMAEGRRVYLDARQAVGAHFPARFPTIYAACRAAGIDPVTMPIPVCPAAHYQMGGIVTDACGRSSVEGLWACGEAASTGLHGANRLASNSLLEVVVTGIAMARDLAGTPSHRLQALSSGAAPPLDEQAPPLDAVRDIMDRHLGVIRDRAGLATALDRLAPLVRPDRDPGPAELALTVAAAAFLREESRGSHFRADFPYCAERPMRRVMTLEVTYQMAGIETGPEHRRAHRG